MRQIIVTENDANQRLDRFLAKFLPSMPQGMLYKGLRKDCVRVNGKHVRDGAYILREGDELRLYFKDEFYAPERKFTPLKAELDIVYEDENFLIINKPAGLVVHADDKGTRDTLADRVQGYLYLKGEYYPEKEHSFAPALCNRLDRNTSGLVIAAKNAAALREMNENIRLRKVRKYYLCIADGIMEGSGELTGQLTREEKRVRITDSVCEGSKEVRLNYRVLSHSGGKALLEVELLTGRTHQIRAQLAKTGHPLTGDVKYGGSRADGGYRLCSYKLEFDFDGEGTMEKLAHKKIEIRPEWAVKKRRKN